MNSICESTSLRSLKFAEELIHLPEICGRINIPSHIVSAILYLMLHCEGTSCGCIDKLLHLSGWNYLIPQRTNE